MYAEGSIKKKKKPIDLSPRKCHSESPPSIKGDQPFIHSTYIFRAPTMSWGPEDRAEK